MLVASSFVLKDINVFFVRKLILHCRNVTAESKRKSQDYRERELGKDSKPI